MKSEYELLAPAGDFATLVTALNAGADAVYIGLKEFSMRAGAKNFSLNDLTKLQKIKSSYLNKPKIYLTLNTIIYDHEIPNVEKILQKVKKSKSIDAIICWDFSIISLCKKYKIPFFISTQASVSNSESAKFFKKLGAKRIVLARELDLKQIKEISKIKNLEIECFCHGAMCVAISGRCFTSQFLFNKSANRGQCLHPCRRSYSSYKIKDQQEGYELELENNKVLSAKDLCTLPFIEKLKSVGIKCFKIEGRNRDPRYVDVVVRAYRKALDKKLSKKETNQLVEDLAKVYNREFSSGFYLGLPTPDDFARVEHSASKEKKHFVGKITNYYKKINVATLKLSSKISLGDEIVVIGNKTGILNYKINSLQEKYKEIKNANKGQEVGIKIPLVRKNDQVYKINKN